MKKTSAAEGLAAPEKRRKSNLPDSEGELSMRGSRVEANAGMPEKQPDDSDLFSDYSNVLFCQICCG